MFSLLDFQKIKKVTKLSFYQIFKELEISPIQIPTSKIPKNQEIRKLINSKTCETTAFWLHFCGFLWHCQCIPRMLAWPGEKRGGQNFNFNIFLHFSELQKMTLLNLFHFSIFEKWKKSPNCVLIDSLKSTRSPHGDFTRLTA